MIVPSLRERVSGPSLARLGALALQLLLIHLLVFVFRVESLALQRVLALALGGCLVHEFLPQRLRLPFFATLSLGGIVWVLGPVPAAWLVGLGLALIGLAHLPTRFGTRVALVAAAGALLAAMRASWLPAPWPVAIWPVLGSMFMFRLVIYLYDLRTHGAPFGASRALSYFFMLPNVCFPLFPVVDYRTFCLTHYNDERFRIYQTGVQWMLRGIVQLLLYRLLYQRLLVEPATVRDLADLARHAVTTYLLYLRVSGAFHLVVGILHLFGFNLSETHHRYLLASSVSDLWQRINIYWKDFTTKLVFYPACFALKDRIGAARATVLATGIAFAASWLLHSYQWFWLRGTFPLTWQDALFWGVLGALVALKTARDRGRPARRGLKPPALTVGGAALAALRVVRTFLIITVLWTVWTVESFDELRTLFAAARHASLFDLVWIGGGLVGLGLCAVAFGRSARQHNEAGGGSATFPFWRSVAGVLLVSGALLAVGRRPTLLGFDPPLMHAIDRLKTFELNEQDAALLERGYYEDLGNPTRLAPELWELYQRHRLVRPFVEELPGVRRRQDLLRVELPPSTTLQFKGVPMTINRWGFRDRDFEETPPPGTYRFELLGASISQGHGVRDDETYENLVEDGLNHRSPSPTRRYEVLNLSIGNYGPLSKLYLLEAKGFAFAPHAVLYESSAADADWLVHELVEAFVKGYDVPWDFLVDAARRAGVDEHTRRARARVRLLPHADELLEQVYRHMVEECRAHGAEPYLLHLPRLLQPDDAAEAARMTEIAQRAGFVVLDLSHAYDHAAEQGTLVLALWDRHPNAAGHRLLAESLFDSLVPHLPED